MTALVGYVMGTRGPVSFSRLGVALAGTALVAAGASALNMLLERRTDALMLRTRNRPVAAGRLRVAEALAFGLALTVAGLGVLRFGAGPLAALVALVTWASYLFAYTPLKTRTSLSTIVGAFPGALPPVIGWAAARGQIEPGAVVLFAILFLWQIPHFLAIAWIYREDYARGGLPMLPVLDPAGVVTGRQAVANSLALLLVSVVPTHRGADRPSVLRRRRLSRHRLHFGRGLVRDPAHGGGGPRPLPRLDPVPACALHPASRRSGLDPPTDGTR